MVSAGAVALAPVLPAVVGFVGLAERVAGFAVAGGLVGPPPLPPVLTGAATVPDESTTAGGGEAEVD